MSRARAIVFHATTTAIVVGAAPLPASVCAPDGWIVVPPTNAFARFAAPCTRAGLWQVQLPPVLQWYRQDFGDGSQGALLRFVAGYVRGRKRAQLVHWAEVAELYVFAAVVRTFVFFFGFVIAGGAAACACGACAVFATAARLRGCCTCMCGVALPLPLLLRFYGTRSRLRTSGPFCMHARTHMGSRAVAARLRQPWQRAAALSSGKSTTGRCCRRWPS